MINIFKIGGNVINDPESLKSFLKDFSLFEGRKILVHGGGKEATDFSKRMGIEAQMIEGRRITDAATLEIVTMVYAGLINKRIVALLQDFGCDAVGLTGADGNVIPAQKRNSKPLDYGYVGDIDPAHINTKFISTLLDNGNVPVFCAICRNPEGGLLNCNADSVASALGVACAGMEETNLIYCFEKPGVMENVDDENSMIPLITTDIYDTLKAAGKISGGMIPKVENALKALRDGVKMVMIGDARGINEGKGTTIRL